MKNRTTQLNKLLKYLSDLDCPGLFRSEDNPERRKTFSFQPPLFEGYRTALPSRSGVLRP